MEETSVITRMNKLKNSTVMRYSLAWTTKTIYIHMDWIKVLFKIPRLTIVTDSWIKLELKYDCNKQYADTNPCKSVYNNTSSHKFRQKAIVVIYKLFSLLESIKWIKLFQLLCILQTVLAAILHRKFWMNGFYANDLGCILNQSLHQKILTGNSLLRVRGTRLWNVFGGK